MFRHLRHTVGLVGLFLAFATAGAEPQAEKLPRCRLDNASASVVKTTLLSVANAYAAENRPRLFDAVEVNPRKPSTNPRIMTVYVISDAGTENTNAQGCIKAPLQESDALDEFSVPQVCVTLPGERLEIRCSAQAVKAFSGASGSTVKASPGLLYVLAHEVAHLYQRRAGEYSGRVAVIDLRRARDAKLEVMREACGPMTARFEKQADDMALAILVRLLPLAPYRNLALSERGSMLWNVDHLNMSWQQWQATSVQHPPGGPRLHDAFIPTEWPTPTETVQRNAQRFVCDVLTLNTGEVFYPASAGTHPPLEQRVQRIAEQLQPVALALPESDGQQPFQPVASLQEQVSPVLNLIYRESGIYLESVHQAICTRINSDDPMAGCNPIQ